MLIVGRVINGISVGICSAQVPVYISELVSRYPYYHDLKAQRLQVDIHGLLTIK
jgi:MFS family permease